MSFDDAARAFIDPNRIETLDGRDAYGKDRWKTVGLVKLALLAVVYPSRGNNVKVIRLISAIKADAMSACNTVTFRLGPRKPVPLSIAQRKRLGFVRAMSDADINFSDIPQQ